MARQRTWIRKSVIVAASLVAGAATVVAACAEPANPIGGATPSGEGAAGAVVTGSCEDGEQRACQVDLDDANCFVGVQQCEDGEWGPCLDADGLQVLSAGGFGGCPNNPCNPDCQLFDDEKPANPITAPHSAPPAGATGTINDVPAPYLNACLNDTAHLCGSQCTSTGYCQFDTYCDIPDLCKPWTDGQHDTTGQNKANLTIGVACDPSKVPVCNRGDVPAGNGAGISIWVPSTDICGGVGVGVCQGAAKTGIPSTMIGTCNVAQDIQPGECIEVDCSGVPYASAMYHINGCDEFGCPITESDEDDNWGYYDSSVMCSCSSTSTTGSLTRVNMYMLLDTSTSMAGSAQGCNQSWCTDCWDSTAAALASFLVNPSADPIRVQFTVYDKPDGRCDTDGMGGVCDSNFTSAVAGCEVPVFALDQLTGTHDTDIANWLNNVSNAPQYPPDTADTPHRAALEAAANVVSDWHVAYPDDRNVIVYISDGSLGGTCSGSNQTNIASRVSGAEAFTIALPGSSISLLNAISAAGGTGAAIDLRSYAPGPALNAAVETALLAIQDATVSCQLAVANPGSVDFSALSGTWIPSVGPSVALADPPVASLAACDPTPPVGVMEYFLVPNASNPTGIELCPAACGVAHADPTGTIDLLGGCVSGGYAQYTHGPIPYDADCTNYGNGTGKPVWDFLTYDTTQVGDSSIMFQIRTGKTPAEANAGPFTTVSIADQASPDAPGANPVVLAAALPLGAVYNPSMQLQMILNPTSDGTGTPELVDWTLQFTCASAE